MIPDFPHNIRIRLAQWNFFCCVLTLLCLCSVGCLSLFYCEESLVSSNLNSNLLRFHCAHPNLHTYNPKGKMQGLVFKFIEKWKMNQISCGLYCRVVCTTGNFSYLQNPRFIIKSDFKSRADYNGARTVLMLVQPY